MFAVGFLELVGEFAKVASLSFRLFGNVFAGEVLLASMGAIIAYILPTPFLLLEIFVGVIQAFIFAILTLVYYTISAQDHDEEHETDESHENTADSAHKEVVAHAA
jgi:F-type H+-transporting ATPase subunit a